MSTQREPSATGAWTVGAERVPPRRHTSDLGERGVRLHAVGGLGHVYGRAVCLAPVTLLDPAGWRWPDDGGDDWPRCCICLALTS